MNALGGAPEQRSPRLRVLATIGAGGVILILATVAAYFLTQASPGVLAATWWTVITTGLIGLIVMIYVLTARQSLPGAAEGGHDPRSVSGPGSAPPMDDIDAELLRILADARLGDASTRPIDGRARGRRAL